MSSDQSSSLNMPHEEEVIIKMWQDQPILWDVSHPNYRDCLQKELARKEIGDAVGRTSKQIKDKLKNLNDCYVKARRKCTQSGSLAAVRPGTRDDYVLEKLHFLLPSKLSVETKPILPQYTDKDKACDLESSISLAETNCSPPALENNSSPDATPRTFTKKAQQKTNKRKRAESILASIGKMYHSNTGQFSSEMEVPKVKTEEEVFAEYIGVALHNLTPPARQWCMMEIHSALYKARTGLWNEPADSTLLGQIKQSDS